MPRLLKPLLLITVVLVLPIVLLALTGESFTDQLARWQADPPSRPALAAAIVAILAADVILPVPSGPVSTLAGSQLGVLLGTATSALGMTLGAVIAYALARRYGRPLVERLTSPERLQHLEASAVDHSPWMLALTRPLPIIAEAAALFVGALHAPLRVFLPPVILTNVALAAAYSALGAYASHSGWLPLAIAASVALPLAVTLIISRRRTV